MSLLARSLLLVSLVLLGGLVLAEATDGDAFGATFLLGAASLSSLALFCVGSLRAIRSGRATAVSKLWLLTGSCALAYLIVDLVAGALLLPEIPTLTPDAVVHHRLEPNSVARYRTTEYDYVQKVNSIGLRGREVSDNKPPGIYRILMLGDSFTMGKGVADDQTFSAVLEGSLNRRRRVGASNTVEVLNAGVDSYAPVLSLLQLIQIAPRIEPDLVVLNLDMGDLVQETVYRQAATRDSTGRVIAVDGTDVSESDDGRRPTHVVRSWVGRHFYLATMVPALLDEALGSSDEQSIWNTVVLSSRDLLLHTLESDPVDRGEQWKHLFDSILRIQRYCQERQLDFLLVIYPWAHQVSDTEWIPGRRSFIADGAVVSDASLERIESFASANGIRFLSAFPKFRGFRAEEKLYFRKDPHWTPLGNEIMAKELERVIETTFLTP